MSVTSLKDIFLSSAAYKQLNARLKENTRELFITPLAGCAKPLTILEQSNSFAQVVVFLPSVQDVRELYVELSLLAERQTIVAITEVNPGAVQEVLSRLTELASFILILPYSLLSLPIPRKEELTASTTLISADEGFSYNELLDLLDEYEYKRDKFADTQGQYAVRGAIIDFWSFSERRPARIEFNGDYIESIRSYDPDSQRSIEKADAVTLAPQQKIGQAVEGNIFGYLNEPLCFIHKGELERALAKAGRGTGITYNSDDEALLKELLESDVIQTEEPGEEFDFLPPDLRDALANPGGRWIIEEDFAAEDRVFQLNLSNPPEVNSNYNRLFTALTEAGKNGYTMYVAAENELQANRYRQVFDGAKDDILELYFSGKLRVTVFPAHKGLVLRDEKVMIFTDYQLFNKPYRSSLPKGQKAKRSRAKELAGLKYGDYVVHETYGIGKYLGLETIKIGDTDVESMKLTYANNDIVYVNLNYLHLVKKYSASESAAPALTRLGSPEWQTSKRKAKKKIKEAARELIELYARRKSAPGFSFSPDSMFQRELETSFIYEDTPDQAKVTEEIKRDMETPVPMDRLVCGDVGFGKTEIAVRAAFKAVQDGKQVAVLVPTTILAEQHGNTFTDRLGQFGVGIAVLSRFQSKAEQKEIVTKMKEGKLDIIIGTHRLLSKDIQFKDVGLLIIDEEHRFGVKAKETLKSLRINIDTMTLSATPIPRTLNLSLLGARDLSIISTPPPNRQPVYTKVDLFRIDKIREWINRELERDGQVYFVHDRIQSIEKIASYIRKYMPDLRIAVAHGQMKPQILEDVFHGFLNKKYDILLSTKIIESGLDIPNVNTIIVNRADRFGLAELHQLRGRVGRSNRQAYAYLLVPTMDALRKETVQRLRAIEEHSDLGSGFQLAMRDLEIRGAGNLLGMEQSGAVDEIGFDLYLKLVNEAVDELKKEEFSSLFQTKETVFRTDASVEPYFDVNIPKGYMPDQMDRLGFYTALSQAAGLTDLAEIRDELIDKYGTMPVPVSRLLLISELRHYSSLALFDRVIIKKEQFIITLPKDASDELNKELLKMVQKIDTLQQEGIRFEQKGTTLRIVINNGYGGSPEKELAFLIRFTKGLLPENVVTN